MQLSESPFLLVFSLYFIWQLFQTSTFFLPFPAGFEKTLLVLLCLSLLPRIPALIKTKKLYLAGAALMALNYLLVYRADHFHFLLFSAVLTLGFTSVDHRKVMKLYTLILGCFLVLTFSAACCDAIQSFVYLKDGYIRTALGICYPTDMASYVLFLLMYAWAAWRRIPDLTAFLLGILCTFFSRYIAMSITGTICSIFFSAAVLGHFLCEDCMLRKRLPISLKKLIRELMTFAFPILGLAMFALIFAYAKNIGPVLRLNGILSNRLKFPLESLQTYGLHAFGAPLPQNGNGFTNFAPEDYNFVDSSYPLILLRYGWVIFLMLCAGWVTTTRKAFLNHDLRLACLLTLIAVHSFSEHHFIEVNFNPLVVMPFAMFSTAASVPENDAESENAAVRSPWSTELKHNLQILAGLCALAGFATLFLPWFFTRMRTIVQLCAWSGGGANGYKILLVLGGIYGLLLLAAAGLSRSLHIMAWYSGKDRFTKLRAPLLLTAGSMILLSASYFSGERLIRRSFAQQKETLLGDYQDVQLIADLAFGKVYVDSVPALYQLLVSGIHDSPFHGDELARFSNTSVITDLGYDSKCFINSGFLFTPISASHALYTNDMALISALKDKGKHLKGYYNVEKDVDLKVLADQNALPCSAGSGLHLSGTEHPLKFGPYLSLYSGTFTAAFELQLPKSTSSAAGAEKADQSLGTLRVSAYWGQKILKEHRLTKNQFDENGHAVIRLPFRIGNYSGIEFLVFPKEDQEFSVLSIRYYRSPAYDVHMLYNKKRQKYREEYYALDGTPTETVDGYSACEYAYNYDGKIIGIRYYDAENQPVLISKGYASLKRELDQKGRTILESYYGTDGEPILCSAGYASTSSGYDPDNNINVQKFYDTNGAPTGTTYVYAEIRRKFNEKHQVILESYYDTSGQPLMMPAGYAMIESRYDSSGRPYIQKYLDGNGRPVITTYHYAEIHREYTPQNWVSKESYYDTDGLPLTLAAGHSMVKKSFDQRGNPVLTEYCDTDGNRVMTTMHYAALKRKYNAKNQIVYQAYLGVNDEPVLISGNYAAVSYERNAFGDAINCKYYDINGKISARSEGYAQVNYEYDDRRLCVHEYYSDSQGNPVITTMQYAGIRREYNDLRQISKESYYDIYDAPMTLRLGQASVSYDRDQTGLPVSLHYYGLDGLPIITTEGYSEVRREYNERRQTISESYFDQDGMPVLKTDGYHKIDFEYDKNGRKSVFRYFGTNAEPILIKWGYCKEQRSYDSDGKISGIKYFDHNGQEVFAPPK